MGLWRSITDGLRLTSPAPDERSDPSIHVVEFGASTPAPDSDFWYSDDPRSEGEDGQLAYVTPDSAMSIAAVYSCVKVIAESIGSLPCEFYRWIGQKDKELAENHPLYYLLRVQPNSWQTPTEFWEMLVGHCCLTGDAYAEIIPGERGSIQALEPLHPRRVRPYWVRQGRQRHINFEVRDDEHDGNQSKTRILTQDEVFRFSLMSRDGLRGMSPIEWLRRPFDLANQMQEHGARLYENDATPGGILRTPNALKKEAKTELRRSWERMHAGPKNKRRVAVMDNGLSWESVGMTMQDAEWIASRKFSRSEIAGIFRVPPHKIGDLERATFGNIEEQNIDFGTGCIRPWAVRIESAIKRDLISQPLSYFAEFNFDELLRGDSEKRASANEKLFRNGVQSQNEWRAKEGMNREPDGDRRYVMVNMVPVDRIDDTIDNNKPTDTPADAPSPEDATQNAPPQETKQ